MQVVRGGDPGVHPAPHGLGVGVGTGVGVGVGVHLLKLPQLPASVKHAVL